MFKDFFDEKTKKKMYTLLSLLGICAVALIVISGLEDKTSKKEEVNKPVINENEKTQGEVSLEEKLEKILVQINGAGEVDVMITYESGEEIQPAYNTNTTTEKTEEKDTQGGERTITTSSENKTMITSNTSEPIIIKTNEAKIKGVIVVASGADEPLVKETLYSAVQTALQIQGHQVEIYDK